jgi:hypothetical protein
MKRNILNTIIAAALLAFFVVGAWWAFAGTRPGATFEIYGITKRGGTFAWSEDTTLLSALATAGGYTTLMAGEREVVYVIRTNTLLRFNPAAIEAGVGEDTHLQPRDIVIVPKQ